MASSMLVGELLRLAPQFIAQEIRGSDEKAQLVALELLEQSWSKKFAYPAALREDLLKLSTEAASQEVRERAARTAELVLYAKE